MKEKRIIGGVLAAALWLLASSVFLLDAGFRGRMSWTLISNEKGPAFSMARQEIRGSTHPIDGSACEPCPWRQAIPLGSLLLAEEFSWESDKSIWLTGLAIIFGLCALAIYLQFSRRQLRQARDAQTRLSRLLISAQEKERTRLAAELHDDFSQRLALLACGLESALESVPEPSQATRQQLHDLWNSASEIGADLHMVSHRLYSATLEKLGLVAGVTTLCKEFAARQGIQVEFSPQNIPHTVPPDVALCLFRIVQEGLQNVKKHSAAARAEVSLRQLGHELHLSVRDEGRGFDTRDRKNKEGMGIQSMEERARLLGGRFEIYSSPGTGTRIEARVPFEPQPAE